MGRTAKFVLVFLCMALCISLLSVPALAEEGGEKIFTLQVDLTNLSNPTSRYAKAGDSISVTVSTVGCEWTQEAGQGILSLQYELLYDPQHFTVKTGTGTLGTTMHVSKSGWDLATNHVAAANKTVVMGYAEDTVTQWAIGNALLSTTYYTVTDETVALHTAAFSLDNIVCDYGSDILSAPCTSTAGEAFYVDTTPPAFSIEGEVADAGVLFYYQPVAYAVSDAAGSGVASVTFKGDAADATGSLATSGELVATDAAGNTARCTVTINSARYDAAVAAIAAIPAEVDYSHRDVVAAARAAFARVTDAAAAAKLDEAPLLAAESTLAGIAGEVATLDALLAQLPAFGDVTADDRTTVEGLRADVDAMQGKGVAESDFASIGMLLNAELKLKSMDESLPTLTVDSITADGASQTEDSTRIDVVFSQPIDGLAAGDLRVSGMTGEVEIGAVSGEGASWSIQLLSVAKEGTVWIELPSPAGHVLLNAKQAVYVNKAGSVTLLSATPDGTAGTQSTTEVALVFDKDIQLTADDILIDDITGSVAVASVEGSGQAWTVKLEAVAFEGLVQLEVLSPDGYTVQDGSLQIEVSRKHNLTAKASPTYGAIDLGWDAAGAAAGYLVKRADSAEGEFQTIKTIVGGQQTSYQDAGLGSNATYYYKVIPFRQMGGETVYGFDMAPVSARAEQEVPLQSIKIGKTAVTVNVGASTTLTITYTPTNASNKTITWVSDNDGIATVSSSGVVKGVKAGTARITGTSVDGNKKVTCTVTVKQPVTKVTLSPTVKTIKVGATVTLKPTIAPTNATSKAVSWTTSSKSIATVSSKGVVKGIKAGKVTITATAKDGSGVVGKATIYVGAPVTKIKLNTTSTVLRISKSVTLKTTFSPANAQNKTVTWTSSNPSVATVSSKGVVKGIKVGTATITVKTQDGSKVATCKVTVRPAVTGVTISPTLKTVKVGGSLTIKPTVAPSNAAIKTVTWKSSNTKIATVSSKGVVKGIKAGKVTITCTTADGAKKATATIYVGAPVTRIKLDRTSHVLKLSTSFTLKPIFSPTNAQNKTITWTSSDTSVATVSSKGVVKGVKLGTATITAKTQDGSKVATCKVTVRPAVTGVTISPVVKTVKVGGSVTIKPTIVPSNAAVKTVTWKSSNTKIATVSSSGVVKGVKAGKVTISCTTADGAKRATATIYVGAPATGIKLDKTSHTLLQDSSFTLKTTFTPSNAQNKTIIWTSSDEGVATVSTGGVVTGYAPGVATITATAQDGGFTARCQVTVEALVPVEGVSLSEDSKTMRVGDVFLLEATVLPETANNKALRWTSTNEGVASVDENGNVTALAEGEATITVTTLDGSFTATCIITVTL